MKFSLVSANRVQSDHGFTLWLRTPFNLHYLEGERELVIPGEMLTGEKQLLVSASAIKSWNPPFDKHILGKAKQEQIRANTAAALDFLGIGYEFD